MSSNSVRVRFAPSPTGDFHVGGARTALFNYLFARHHGGKFILRIEDTDRNRFNPDSLKLILDGLNYLGLEWDEGPEMGGPYGPYTQSERFDLYKEASDRLIHEEKAYRCFCTAERLDTVRKEREKAKLSHGYDRHCRNMDPSESLKRKNSTEPYTVRFKMPLDGKTAMNDLILGHIEFNNNELQDSILMKADGSPTYHLANIVDDHAMEISHILRGSEWVNSLPLHINLYAAFGWEAPKMAHLPLILNPSGKGKLSKRNQVAADGKEMPVFVHAFEKSGYLKDAMVNYLALLGWSFDDHTEIMNREELVERFSIERISSSPAAWNYDKLNHINGQYIRTLEPEVLKEKLAEYLNKNDKIFDSEKLSEIVPLIHERIETLGQAWEKMDFFFDSVLKEYDAGQLLPKKTDKEKTISIISNAVKVLDEAKFDHDSIDSALRNAATEMEVKVGQLFQPIRVAVCGKMVAPPLIETLVVLGKENVINRLESAIQKLKLYQE